MVIYEVCYEEESGRDGYARSYATSAKEAKAIVRLINQRHAAAVKTFQDAIDAGVGHYQMPANPGNEPRPQIARLVFTGTARQMVLDALRHNTD